MPASADMQTIELFVDVLKEAVSGPEADDSTSWAGDNKSSDIQAMDSTVHSILCRSAGNSLSGCANKAARAQEHSLRYTGDFVQHNV